MNEPTKKIQVLRRIYDLYDEVAISFASACRKYCAACCTCNVTLTTLEALPIITHLENNGRLNKYHIQNVNAANHRFQPRTTTNGLAARYLAGKQLEEEENEPSWGRCLFLEEDACTIYPVRPFGCRCLLSKEKCGINGSAEITPFLLTVNTVFLQVIEHMDKGGFSGNLADMIQWLSDLRQGEETTTGGTPNEAFGLIPNQPLTCLMVPKEHQEEIGPLIARLQPLLAKPA